MEWGVKKNQSYRFPSGSINLNCSIAFFRGSGRPARGVQDSGFDSALSVTQHRARCANRQDAQSLMCAFLFVVAPTV